MHEDGRKIGTAHNSGKGGETFLYADDKKQFLAAERYCESLPVSKRHEIGLFNTLRELSLRFFFRKIEFSP